MDIPLLTGTDDESDFETVWRRVAPVAGITYQVVRERWNADYTVREILEVELLNCP